MVEVLVLYFLILNINLDKIKIKCFLISLVYSILYLIFRGAGEIRYWSLLYKDRVSGDNPVSVYALLLGCMILILVTETFKNKSKLSVTVNILTGLSVFICMVASQSRGPILFVFLTLIVMLILYNLKLGITTSLIGIFICILALTVIENEYTERIRSIGDLKNPYTFSRVPIWKDSLEIIKDYPLTGIGIGEFHGYRRENKASVYKKELKNRKRIFFQEEKKLKELSREAEGYSSQLEKYQEALRKYRISAIKVKDLKRYGSHNNILELMVSVGIFGFLSYLSIFLIISIKLLLGIIKNRDKEEKLFLISAFGIYLYIHSVGLTDNTIYMRGPMSFAYVIAAMALGYTLRGDRGNEA